MCCLTNLQNIKIFDFTVSLLEMYTGLAVTSESQSKSKIYIMTNRRDKLYNIIWYMISSSHKKWFDANDLMEDSHEPFEMSDIDEMLNHEDYKKL